MVTQPQRDETPLLAAAIQQAETAEAELRRLVRQRRVGLIALGAVSVLALAMAVALALDAPGSEEPDDSCGDPVNGVVTCTLARSGRPVPRDEAVLYRIVFGFHCGNLAGVEHLILEDQGYVRDPAGQLHVPVTDLEPSTPTPYTGYDEPEELPAEAVDSGYRLGETQVWRHGEAAYLVTGARIERWPQGTVGCA